MNTGFELHKASEELMEFFRNHKEFDLVETENQCVLLQIMPTGHKVIVAVNNKPDPVPYEKIVVDVEDKPEIKKHIDDATKLLNYALCSSPDENDEKYDGSNEGWYKDLDELYEKTRRMEPDGFPFSFKIIDDKAYEEVLLSGYDGPVYWNTFNREHMVDWESSRGGNGIVYEKPLKPIKMKDAGADPLTVKSLCEAVAKLDYYPGDHRFLESVEVELRKIDGVEAITIIFGCGS